MTRPSGTAQAALQCLAGGLVLALMWGQQEGSYGTSGSPHESILNPRVLSSCSRRAGLPGHDLLAEGGSVPHPARCLAAGDRRPDGDRVPDADPLDDQLGNGKFGTVATRSANTAGLSPGLGVLRRPVPGRTGRRHATARRRHRPRHAQLRLGRGRTQLAVAILANVSQDAVVDIVGGVDHSLGGYICVGRLPRAVTAGLVDAFSKSQVAATRQPVNGVLGWRPGLTVVALGAVLGLVALGTSTWFSPAQPQRHPGRRPLVVPGHRVDPDRGAVPGLAWLGRFRRSAWSSAGSPATVGSGRWAGPARRSARWASAHPARPLPDQLAGRKQGVDGADGPWQNLGAGGWMTCAALFLSAAGGFIAPPSPPLIRHRRSTGETDVDAVVVRPLGARLPHLARCGAQRRLCRGRARCSTRPPPTTSGSRSWSPRSASTCCWRSG